MTREVVPFYTELTESKSTSMFYTARKLIHNVCSRDDLKLVVFQPKFKLGPEKYWELAGFKHEEAVEFFPIDLDKTTDMPLGYVNDSFLAMRKRQDYFVVLSSRLTASHMLQKALSKPFIGFYPVIVHHVTASDFAADDIKIYPSTIPEAMLSMVMYWNIFHNKGHLERVRKAISQVYNASVVRQFSDRSVFFNLGVECDRIDAAAPMPEVYDKNHFFTLIYGGRPSSLKRLDLVLEVCDRLKELGVPVRLDLCLTMERVMDVNDKVEALKRPYTTIHIGLRAEEFYRVCKNADAFVGTSVAESYGISYVEQMYAGAIGVFLDRPWVKAIIPPGYPYVASNVETAVAQLFSIWKEKGTAKQALHVASMKNFIHAEHNREDHVNQVLNATASLSRAIREKKHPRVWGDVL